MPRKLREKRENSVISTSAVIPTVPKIKKLISQKKEIIKKKLKRSPIKMAKNSERIEHIKISTGTKKNTPLKKGVSKKPSVTFYSNVRVALLSPLRLSLDHPQLVSNIARYTGTAFVVIGALFTLHNINVVDSYVSNTSVIQNAQTVSSTECMQGSTNCTTSSNTGSGAIDTTPTADFNIESSGTALVGTVSVNVTVPLATSIMLTAQSTDSNQTYTLGNLTRVSDLIWRTYWQTSNFLDGTYRLRAVISNQYGTYTSESSQAYDILNHPSDTTAISSNTVTDSSTITSTDLLSPSSTTTGTVDTAVSTTLRVEIDEAQPLAGGVSVRTFVDDASSIRFFLRPQDGTNTTFTPLGYANFRGGSEWRFEMDTLPVPDGSYDLRAFGVLHDGSTVARTIRVDIKNSTQGETTTELTDSLQTDTSLEPEINLNIAGESPLTGSTDVFIEVLYAQYVELYTVQTNVLTPRFVGLAYRQNDTMWRYRLNSLQMPNGSYELFAKVRHAYGDSTSGRIKFSVNNILVNEKTDEETAYVELLTKINEETARQIAPVELPSTLTALLSAEEDSAMRAEMKIVLDSFNDNLNELVDAYARSVRTGDTTALAEARARMDTLEAEIVTMLPQGDERAEMSKRVKEYLASMNTRLRENVERNETIIKERVGEAVTKDTDKDGISDYDEVSIYTTDPFVADTDSDGYIDGVEILSGYNPTDATFEANIRFESPRDSGIVREDLLTVTTIGTLRTNTEEEGTQVAKAMFVGTGLPNSFVTLYIFSTPIIVTVKTDTQGNWSYIFDKELEDGEHEVYVGITDNAGKIVAKSSPFAFVKTAEAFSPVGTAVGATVVTEGVSPALINEHRMLVIGSISVVSLGLVLILLGLHARPRERLLEAT